MFPPTLQPYQTELIEQAMSLGALKFGSFTLKSGRISPYFFNAGLLSNGAILATLATAYAKTLTSTPEGSAPFPQFNVLFGPAYKGIPFAAVTAMELSTAHGIDVGFAYDRKEAKTHGEGGSLVGVPVKDQRVVVLDDVMTAGTAIRKAIELVNGEGGKVVGVVQALDREEVGQDGVSGTVWEIDSMLGGTGSVRSILKMRDLMVWLEVNGRTEELESMKAYREKYGIKA